MIGSLDNAHDARTLGHLLGKGASRSAYLYNDVVYKFEYVSGANAMEIANLNRLSGYDSDSIRVPAFSTYDVNGETVIALPFIYGEPMGECLCVYLGVECDCPGGTVPPNSVLDRIHALGLSDLGYGNIIHNDGTYWIVDLEG